MASVTDAHDESTIRILVLGLEEREIKPLQEVIGGFEIRYMAPTISQFLDPNPPKASLIICGSAPKNSSLEELGQLLRFKYQKQPIFLVCLQQSEFNPQKLKAMGFTEVYLDPIDWTSLKRNIQSSLSDLSGGEIKSYYPVKLVDLKPGVTLNFDTFVYLPVNGRYLPFSKANDPLDEARVKNLQQNQVSTVFIETKNLQKFYAYVNESLKGAEGESEISSITQQKESLQGKVKSFYGKFFNGSIPRTPALGIELTQELKEIAQAHLEPSRESTWYLPLLSWSGEAPENDAHASNVALYAGLFSLKLGIGNPEEVAIAGLLHDCGQVNVKREILNKLPSQRTDLERREYEKHPDYSLTLIKNRKLQISDRTIDLVRQHHVGNNNNGYPKGITASKIAFESQLIGIADQIDELTTLQAGKRRMSPTQALVFLHRDSISNHQNQMFNPELLLKVLELFPKETDSK